MFLTEFTSLYSLNTQRGWKKKKQQQQQQQRGSTANGCNKGSFAASTRTANTLVLLSRMYWANCRNAFRISSSNSSPTMKFHAVQAGYRVLGGGLHRVVKHSVCGLKPRYTMKGVCKYLCMHATAKVRSKTGWDKPS